MANDLTANLPAPPPRRGVIVLARHGEPALSRKVKLTAPEYGVFWERYEIGGLVPGQTPPDHLIDFAAKADVVLSSTRLRSIESAQLLTRGRPFEPRDILIEAPLPPPPWPRWVRLPPKIWGFFARFWWWFFNHHGGQETRAQAEVRSDLCADVVEKLSVEGNDVLVIAHGFFNFMIARSLKQRGWRQVFGEGYKYWSTKRFEPPV